MSTETSQSASYSPHNNRRFFLRREVRSLAYIDLGRDNGGIVLNLSEGGLAIHSAVTLNERRLPHLRFQLPQSTDWVDARGEIAWTNETKMEAGIQLIGLTDEARRRIREWAGGKVRTVPTPAPVAGAAPEYRPTNPPRIDTIPASPTPLPSRREPVEIAHPAAKATPKPASTPPVVRTTSSPREVMARPSFGAQFGWANGRNAGTALSLRLGENTPEPTTRAPWFSWPVLSAFVVGMATLSFFVGLAAGRADFGSSIAKLWRTDATADSVSAAARASNEGPIAGRITVTSRMYVPVAIPTRFDAAKTNRLQVGAIDYRVEPEYPEDAAARNIEGTVQLHLTVGADGNVENVAVMSGPAVLAAPATEAVRQWRFKPTLLDGKPIETEADIGIVFWLRPSQQNP